MPNTPHWNLPYPAGSDNPAIHTAIQILAVALDDHTKYGRGLASARPNSTVGSPGIEGRFYFASDTLVLSYDYGTGWITLGPDTGEFRQVAYDVVAGSEPSGWLLCDGREVSRSGATLALFQKIGTVHGNGDGIGTFNLPDFRGRSPMGKGQGAAIGGVAMTNRSVGQKPGEEVHLLLMTEMPAHTHRQDGAGGAGGVTGSAAPTGTAALAGAHYHEPSSVNQFATTLSVTAGFGTGAPTTSRFIVTGGDDYTDTSVPAEHTHSVSTVAHAHSLFNSGGGLAHNAVHPTTVVSILIKT